jgi:hypothetical protein
MIIIKLKNYMIYNFKEFTDNIVELLGNNEIMRLLNLEFFSDETLIGLSRDNFNFEKR